MSVEVVKNNKVKITKKHEYFHVNVNRKYWNMLIDDVNFLETRWCENYIKLAFEYGVQIKKLHTLLFTLTLLFCVACSSANRHSALVGLSVMNAPRLEAAKGTGITRSGLITWTLSATNGTRPLTEIAACLERLYPGMDIPTVCQILQAEDAMSNDIFMKNRVHAEEYITFYFTSGGSILDKGGGVKPHHQLTCGLSFIDGKLISTQATLELTDLNEETTRHFATQGLLEPHYLIRHSVELGKRPADCLKNTDFTVK